jgi:hypothetical protein
VALCAVDLPKGGLLQNKFSLCVSIGPYKLVTRPVRCRVSVRRHCRCGGGVNRVWVGQGRTLRRSVSVHVDTCL